ncbi:LuxR C-terminal-related transcriptional regulator [Dactylosporangium sp. CA-139114]|uniref:LuxR C-terminal-related transcriptional regulator n=1 Tax=Dactylosporangium sp. CA-139114 TaxID=3239931 RepID=UPI003D95D70A
MSVDLAAYPAHVTREPHAVGIRVTCGLPEDRTTGEGAGLIEDASADELVEAVRTVARGEGVVAPAVTRRVLAAFAGPGARAETAPAPVPLGLLTAREREVLERLGAGLSNATIAARLGIAEATTKTHVSRILAKLGLQSRMRAAIAARQVRSLDT